MQEIEYMDGEKTKKQFPTFMEALHDAEKKAQKRTIRSLKITMMIPSKKRNR